MKKIWIAAMAVLLSAGCGKKTEEKPAETAAPVKTEEPVSAKEYLQPELLEVSGYMTESGDYAKYVVIARNPNPDVSIRFVKFKVKLQDADGKTIAVDDYVSGEACPGDTVAAEGQIDVKGLAPASIIGEAYCDTDDFSQEASVIPASRFFFRDLTLYDKNYPVIVGTLLNDSPYTADSVKIQAVFRDADGDVCGTALEFLDRVVPGENEFQLDAHSIRNDYVSAELYAQDWGSSHTKDDSYVPAEDPVNENIVQRQTAPEQASGSTEASSAGFEEFKKKMDDLEAFFDSYAEFMKTYDSSDTSAMLKYLDMLGKYASAMEALDEIDESALTPEEEAYYTQVMLRISAKMVEAAGQG